MNTSGITIGKVFTMVAFALSCFGLLLFLWLSFGGPIPLKPKGYRVNIGFQEAIQLADESDVRIAGVSVGKVRTKELDDRTNRTLATIELDSEYAPLRSDTRAILRQKTLLGETFVELTPGSKKAPPVPEGGRLPDARVAETVQLDEIFDAFDPVTRDAFQTWQQDAGKAVERRGYDLNNALGTLPEFVAEAGDVTETLDRQKGATRALVNGTATVFNALSTDEAALQRLITASEEVFSTTASRDDALAETFRVFPTFLRESRETLTRVDRFGRATQPLLADLRPATDDLQPTLRDLRAASPDLRRFFGALDPLIRASRTGSPATQRTLRGLRPVLGQLQPFLNQLNPIVRFLDDSQWDVADFLTNGAAGLAAKTRSPAGLPGHYLRQFGPVGAETVAMYRERPAIDRGNAYRQPLSLGFPKNAEFFIDPQFDCVPSGGEVKPAPGRPGCYTELLRPGFPTQFPRLKADAADGTPRTGQAAAAGRKGNG